MLSWRKSIKMSWLRAKLLLGFLVLSGCFVDMGRAFDLSEAQAAFDAVPSITESQYREELDRQPIRQAPQSPPPSTPPRDPGPAPVAIDPEPIEIEGQEGKNEEPLGQGAPKTVLTLDQGCEALPNVGAREVLIVAAFADDLPDADLIFATRKKQAAFADCLSDQGATPRFETRLKTPDLPAPVQIHLYY